jgi:hypothetical protein
MVQEHGAREAHLVSRLELEHLGRALVVEGAGLTPRSLGSAGARAAVLGHAHLLAQRELLPVHNPAGKEEEAGQKLARGAEICTKCKGGQGLPRGAEICTKYKGGQALARGAEICTNSKGGNYLQSYPTHLGGGLAAYGRMAAV